MLSKGMLRFVITLHFLLLSIISVIILVVVVVVILGLFAPTPSHTMLYI